MYKIERIAIEDAEIRTSPFIIHKIRKHPDEICLVWVFFFWVPWMFTISYFIKNNPILWTVAPVIIYACLMFIFKIYSKIIDNKNTWNNLNFEQDRIYFENINQEKTMNLFLSDIKLIELNIKWIIKINYLNGGSGPGLLLKKIIFQLKDKKSSKISAYFPYNRFSFIFKESTNQLQEISVGFDILPHELKKIDEGAIHDDHFLNNENNIKAIQLLYLFLEKSQNINTNLKFKPKYKVPDSLIKIIKKY